MCPRSNVLLALLLIGIARFASAAEPAETQAQREAALASMLSGATLEGSFTVTGREAAKLTSDKYTLGEVKNVGGNNWLFPTRVQYENKDITLPLTLPIEWAGDTPVVVVDNVGMPGLGTFSARVLFFNDHYAGYWQHGEVGGSLFGRIHRAEKPAGVAK
ncbi:MAG: hypothetical protein AB7G28_19310 [Pirellulales bacterium]